jgi:trehalose 6-phosphate synthase
MLSLFRRKYTSQSLESAGAVALRKLLQEKLDGKKFIVVSNREPYIHSLRSGKVQCTRPAGGVTVALDPILQVSRGLWVAHGSGDADARVADARGMVAVPPEQPTYHLKRVWLTPAQLENYYDGFANSALWPLCHVAFRRPVFRQEHWEGYKEVNALFADRVAEEIGGAGAFVFIQDYHLALLPQMLRQRCPQAVIAQFWHIPWPNAEVFRICPWRREILEGLLGNDILGFHIRFHCQNFIDAVDNELEARPDREMTAIDYQGQRTKIRAFPVSVDFQAISRQAASRQTAQTIAALRKKYTLPEKQIIGLGVDRLDYTKGIVERLTGLDKFFEQNSDYLGRVTFVQVAVPSRGQLAEYQQVDQEVSFACEELNQKYGSRSWRPVVLIHENLQFDTLVPLYRMAQFMIVSSLHDGMNLVAKEYVASQVDAQGVLLLSRFTGAARELKDAVLLNPYWPDQIAEAIREAVEMPAREVQRRMTRMRERVEEQDVYKWAGGILKKFARL